MDTAVLKKYATLIAKVGANVQPGQEVFLFAELDQPEFVRMVTEACYACGAGKVTVEWHDQGLERLHVTYQAPETLGTLDSVSEARWKHMADVLPARIFLESEDPDGLSGIDQEKKGRAEQMRYPAIKVYRDRMENRHQWCIAAVPGKAWAKKVFPNLNGEEAEEALWGAILATCRLSCDDPADDPAANWEQHNRTLKARCAWLNSLGIRKLHYSSPNGTDLTVGMIPEGMFCGGSEDTLGGVRFQPNMPTEECFTTPMRGEAEGIVCGTKPLCYRGVLIENFQIRFEGGRAVEWHAEKNGDVLGQIITMDEGSAFLGECALVPDSSPISRSGILFYNTLFDENASCHLALGMGFADCIRGFEDKTLEECRGLGVNDSMVHEDFMIGSDTLDIDAICADGRTVPVFRGGEWAGKM